MSQDHRTDPEDVEGGRRVSAVAVPGWVSTLYLQHGETLRAMSEHPDALRAVGEWLAENARRAESSRRGAGVRDLVLTLRARAGEWTETLVERSGELFRRRVS